MPNLVLVLGAGASAPYGLFTGDQLAQALWRLADSPIAQITRDTPEDQKRILKAAHGARNLLVNDFKFDAGAVMAFGKAFEQSHVASIDLFLQLCIENGKQEFARIGRLAIAAMLCAQESHERLMQQRRSGPCWYTSLWTYLKSDMVEPEDLGERSIEVVTFNYDRSLEEFLFQSLANSFQESDAAKVQRWMEGVPIHHVYGQLGDYGVRPYQHNNSIKEIEDAAKGIRLMHERSKPEDKARRLAISGALNSARVVWFLGFSYQAENLEALGLKIPQFKASTYGTALSLRSGEINDAQDRFSNLSGTRLTFNPSTCDIAIRDWGWPKIPRPSK